MSSEKLISTDTDNEALATPVTQKHSTIKRVCWLLSLCVMTILIAAVVFPRNTPIDSQQNSLQSQETSKAQYLNILSEPHEGLRLARLNDYVQNVEQNPNTEQAVLAADKLAIQEQKAWAALSDARYNLRKTDAQKQEALQHYIEVWGRWNRQDQLDEIMGKTTRDDADSENLKNNSTANYAPNRKRSKFAKSKTPDALAGAIPTAVYTPPPPPKPIAKPKPKTLRIKYAKKPRYPKRAQRRGIEAHVVLALDIDERGRVARAHVVSVTAQRYKRDFARAARRAALGSRFDPQTKNGHPIATPAYIREYTFVNGD